MSIDKKRFKKLVEQDLGKEYSWIELTRKNYNDLKDQIGTYIKKGMIQVTFPTEYSGSRLLELEPEILHHPRMDDMFWVKSSDYIEPGVYSLQELRRIKIQPGITITPFDNQS